MTPGIMKRRWAVSITATLVLSLTVLAAGAGGAAAQDSSITLVSNMGQPTKALPSERWDDRDHSQAFTTGAESSGYNVTSVAFDIRIATGGTTDPTYEVKIQEADNQDRPTGDSLGMFVRSDQLTTGVNTFSVDGSPVHLEPNTQYVLVFDFKTVGTRRVRIRVTESDIADAGGAPSWSTATESLSRVGTSNFSTLDGYSLKFTISGYAGAAVRSVYDLLEDYFSGTGALSDIEAVLPASSNTYYEKLSEIVEAGELHERVPAGPTQWGTEGTEDWVQVGTPSSPNAWRMPDGTVRYNEDGPTCGGERQPALKGDDLGKFFWACTPDNQWVPVRLPQPGVDYSRDEDLVRPGQPGYDDRCLYRDEDGTPRPAYRTDPATGQRIAIHGNNWDPIAEQCRGRD